VRLEQALADVAAAHALATGGLQVHARSAELHAAKAAIELGRGEVEAARATYARALKLCPDASALWIGAAALEAADGNTGKARSLLESARIRTPGDPALWLEAVRVERRANNAQAASAMMAKAVQQCPTAGVLWAEAIAMEPRQSQKAKSSDAIKRCDNDPHVILAVSRLFWRDRKLDKARVWCNRAAALDPKLGDAWANYLAFELEHGSVEQQADVLARAVEAGPKHGECWKKLADEPANHSTPVADLVKRCAAAMKLS